MLSLSRWKCLQSRAVTTVVCLQLIDTTRRLYCGHLNMPFCQMAQKRFISEKIFYTLAAFPWGYRAVHASNFFLFIHKPAAGGPCTIERRGTYSTNGLVELELSF